MNGWRRIVFTAAYILRCQFVWSTGSHLNLWLRSSRQRSLQAAVVFWSAGCRTLLSWRAASYKSSDSGRWCTSTAAASHLESRCSGSSCCRLCSTRCLWWSHLSSGSVAFWPTVSAGWCSSASGVQSERGEGRCSTRRSCGRTRIGFSSSGGSSSRILPHRLWTRSFAPLLLLAFPYCFSWLVPCKGWYAGWFVALSCCWLLHCPGLSFLP